MSIRKIIKVGSVVRYIPDHAFYDAYHPDCETGIVVRINENGWPWVRYFRNEDLCATPELTDPKNLMDAWSERLYFKDSK